MARQNYLNNRDLLLEIHKSKKTYATYRDIEIDSDFDLILDDLSFFSLTPIYESYDKVLEVKQKMAEDLAQADYDRDIKIYNELGPGEFDVQVDLLNYVPNIKRIGVIDKYTETIQFAKERRADRIARSKHKAALVFAKEAKLSQFAIDPESFDITDLVFRVTTWDHIPIAPPKIKKKPVRRRKKIPSNPVVAEEDEPEESVKAIKYVKVNFPPWYHWRLNEDGELFQVAKSHWKGSYNEGEFDGVFSIDHGSMTDKLAHMFMKLCERYATRANWRGYTYNDEMQGQALLQLAQIGLQFNEARGDNPFAYYTTAITNSFTRVLNTEKRNQEIRDDILEANNYTPSYTRQNDNDIYILKQMEDRRLALIRAGHNAQ